MFYFVAEQIPKLHYQVWWPFYWTLLFGFTVICFLSSYASYVCCHWCWIISLMFDGKLRVVQHSKQTRLQEYIPLLYLGSISVSERSTHVAYIEKLLQEKIINFAIENQLSYRFQWEKYLISFVNYFCLFKHIVDKEMPVICLKIFLTLCLYQR